MSCSHCVALIGRILDLYINNKILIIIIIRALLSRARFQHSVGEG